MRISAKADYAVRAAVELAAADDAGPMKADQIATAQGIPLNFLLNILAELRHARLVQSHRGAAGGFRLARSPSEITLADVIRAVEGPLANVHEVRPDELEYPGPASALRDVWIAVRANLRAVLETVTLQDLARGSLPRSVRALVKDPDAWAPR
ncbi:MAG TPA: Rrf2 family transcriptional regulator [Actinomycetota bacterium]|jgi:Rrf2 family protein